MASLSLPRLARAVLLSFAPDAIEFEPPNYHGVIKSKL
jgi:hypothetical protein